MKYVEVDHADSVTSNRPAGRLFGNDATAYASGRPGYPRDLFGTLADRCGLREGTATLEIGAGAGQATADLLALGARPLTVVEPDPGFSAYLREHYGDRLDVHNVPFEKVHLPDQAFSLATSATAWHWVDQDTGLNAVARTLVPGGWWACWWTVYFDPYRHDPLAKAILPILDQLPSPPLPKTNRTPAEFAFDKAARLADLEATGFFTQANMEEFSWTIELDPADARALYGTFARVVALPTGERERVLDEIETVVRETFNGRAARPVVTVLYTAQRR